MQERRGRDGEKKKKKKKPIIPSVGWAWRVRSVCAQQSYRYSQEKEKPWISAGLCSQRGCPLHQINRRRRRQPRVPSTLAGVMVLACCAACLWRWRVAFPPVLLRYSPPLPTGYPTSANLTLWGLVIRPPLLLPLLLLLHTEATPFFLPQCVSSFILSRRRAIVDA